MPDLFDQEDIETFAEAIDLWGYDAQADMAVEECAELITTFQHRKRGRAEIPDLIDELADIRIMYEQMAMFFGRSEVEDRVQYKMNRLRERIEETDPDGS